MAEERSELASWETDPALRDCQIRAQDRLERLEKCEADLAAARAGEAGLREAVEAEVERRRKQAANFAEISADPYPAMAKEASEDLDRLQAILDSNPSPASGEAGSSAAELIAVAFGYKPEQAGRLLATMDSEEVSVDVDLTDAEVRFGGACGFGRRGDAFVQCIRDFDAAAPSTTTKEPVTPVDDGRRTPGGRDR